MFETIDTITPVELRERMNLHCKAGLPFVWGIDYEMRKGFFLETPYEPRKILWQMGHNGNCGGQKRSSDRPPVLRRLEEKALQDYPAMFARIKDGLLRGDSFLANLTARTPVECDTSLKDVFLSSHAPYRILLGDEFVCFSPEPFVTIENGTISTFPMKGTIDASLPDAEKTLIDNYKEMCEHFTIVDLMRNDLNRVARNVRVIRFRYVEKIMTGNGAILQTSSEIRGEIGDDDRGRAGDIIFGMLPAGSITGAPKPATVSLIASAERCRRGWYTGVFGHFDGKRMESAVMIRCLQRDTDGTLYFHSGGGITVNSIQEEEYSELLTKIYLS